MTSAESPVLEKLVTAVDDQQEGVQIKLRQGVGIDGRDGLMLYRHALPAACRS